MLQEAALLAMLMGSAETKAPSPLEQQIRRRVEEFRGTLGVYVSHLGTGETAAVNADMRFPTASLIKTAVMVEVFHAASEKRLGRDQLVTLTDPVKVGGSGVLHSLRAGSQYSVDDLLYLMIALSDNTATNLLIDLVGTKAVDDRMVAYGLPLTRLYRPTFRGGKADVFPEEEREYGLGSTTPREMAGLMELISRGKAVDAKASAEMLALLRKQQVLTMIPRLLPGEEAGVWVASKSGQDEEKLADESGLTGAVRTDAAIVETPKGRYVIAVLARRGRDRRWTADNESYLAGAAISRLVFDHFTR